MSRVRTRHLLVAAALGTVVLTTVACGGSTNDTAQVTNSQGQALNLTSKQDRIIPAKVPSIAAELPKSLSDKGTLVIGVGTGVGNPPFAFPASDDNKTFIGDEIDVAYLVAGVLGLKVDIEICSWEGLFLGLDSGKYDTAISNVTVTEDRKQKYDFATYRQDNLAMETMATADWTFAGADSLAGKTVAVTSGTTQEKLLVSYGEQLKKEGKKPLTIKNYQDNSGTYAALSSGQIDAFFGPSAVSSFHVAQVAGTPQATKIVGSVSGAGLSLQGLIGATVLKNNGMIKPIADALNYVIGNGDYAKVFERWGLTNQEVKKSEINPPGLPLTNK